MEPPCHARVWYTGLTGCTDVPSNGVRLMCGVRLMVNKTNHFNTEFVLKTPPTVVYISVHVYLTETQLPMTVMSVTVHYLVKYRLIVAGITSTC